MRTFVNMKICARHLVINMKKGKVSQKYDLHVNISNYENSFNSIFRT